MSWIKIPRSYWISIWINPSSRVERQRPKAAIIACQEVWIPREGFGILAFYLCWRNPGCQDWPRDHPLPISLRGPQLGADKGKHTIRYDVANNPRCSIYQKPEDFILLCVEFFGKIDKSANSVNKCRRFVSGWWKVEWEIISLSSFRLFLVVNLR